MAFLSKKDEYLGMHTQQRCAFCDTPTGAYCECNGHTHDHVGHFAVCSPNTKRDCFVKHMLGQHTRKQASREAQKRKFDLMLPGDLG